MVTITNTEYRKYMNISNMNITNMKITICNVLGKANVFLLGQVQIEKNEKEELEWMAQNNDAPARVEIFTPFFTRIFSTHFCSIFQYFQKKILFFLCEQFWDKIEFMLFILLSKKQSSCNNLYFSDLLASDLCFWKVFYNFPVWYETSTFYF